ncbi:hypothetical protein RJ640_028086 [Escallonia rubra]|uniref:Uncharacterized protein n=1 Tax=Escallonia rubra TaxID=112253 RepID=A0AA88QYQ1_9ASTE|nr:hypothetical protein RJ640_028086 [Escallonia rubra]
MLFLAPEYLALVSCLQTYPFYRFLFSITRKWKGPPIYDSPVISDPGRGNSTCGEAVSAKAEEDILCNRALKYYFYRPAVLLCHRRQAPPALSSFVSKKEHEGVESAGMKSLRALALLGAGVSGLLGFATIASADEAEHGLECPSYPWPHKGILSSYDHAS